MIIFNIFTYINYFTVFFQFLKIIMVTFDADILFFFWECNMFNLIEWWNDLSLESTTLSLLSVFISKIGSSWSLFILLVKDQFSVFFFCINCQKTIIFIFSFSTKLRCRPKVERGSLGFVLYWGKRYIANLRKNLWL